MKVIEAIERRREITRFRSDPLPEELLKVHRKFKRSWGMWYAFDNVTGNSVSLKTRVKTEAEQKVNAMNETERQPSISLGLARVYLNATDPKLATRTWQEVMENIVAKKTDETRRRWDVAIKDRNSDCIRNLPVAETRPEHFDRALAASRSCTAEQPSPSSHPVMARISAITCDAASAICKQSRLPCAPRWRGRR
jgi:hypothetical protein